MTIALTVPSAPELSDAELLRRHHAGCGEAFAQLVDRHRVLLNWTLSQAGVPYDDRADLLQDALLKVHRTAATFRGAGSAASWLCTIARNTALSHVRRISRRNEDSHQSLDQDVPLPELTCRRAVDAGRAVQRLVLNDAVNSLHPGLRDVFMCTEVHDWPLDRTAEYLGVPVGTVKSRRARARAQLRQRLTEE